jgi:HupE/UreJ protein
MLRASIRVVLLLALPLSGFAAGVADELTIRAFVKPDGARLHLLLRVPLKALSGLDFPLRGANGELDLSRIGAVLPSAARWWIAENVELYEDGLRLATPEVVQTLVSLPSDNSFASFDEAWAHVTGARLSSDTQVFRDQAMLDVLLDYRIHSDRSSFAVHSALSRLSERVSTDLRFLPAGGPSGDLTRTFEYQGDPGLFQLDPGWRQAVQRFVPLGFFQILKGTDALLFLFCVALLFRNFLELMPFVIAFAVAHSTTLIASAYNLASDALWFPVLMETLIAVAIVYMAFENIVFILGTSNVVRRPKVRWPLAFGFGLVYGFGFAFALRPALQFAGSHVLASVLSFNLGVELGQLLVLLLLVPALDVLFRFTAAQQSAQRMETIILSALAADIGWHRVTDRADQLSQFSFQWPAFDAALLASGMRWLTIFLVLGGVASLVFAALRHRAGRSQKPGGAENPDAALSGTERRSAL